MSTCQCAYFSGVGEADEKISPEVLSAAVSEGCESCCHGDQKASKGLDFGSSTGLETVKKWKYCNLKLNS